MADDRVQHLEAEREHLTTLTSQLENEVQTYREVVSTYESGGMSLCYCYIAFHLLHGNIDQTLVNSLLLNFEIGEIDCRVITTKYTSGVIE